MAATAIDRGGSDGVRQQAFVAAHYASRARDYLLSPTHAAGADLDQMVALAERYAPARVLDVGCGAGHVALQVARHAGAVVACDLTQAMLAVVREQATLRGIGNLRVQQAAAEHLPFADASFDMVLCRFSAHHWDDLDAGLRELRRVLTPVGRAVLADTVAPVRPLLDTHLQTLELLRDPSHVRNYRADEWAAWLARAGLDLVGLTPRRLRLDFPSWVGRTGTGAARVAALHAVQAGAPEEVRRHFEIEADGSWTIDTLLMECAAGAISGEPVRSGATA